MRLRAALKVTTLAGSPPASGAIATPASSAMVLSGPTDRTREPPITAYTIMETNAVHNPVTGGTPTIAEYAITCGTRYAATASPAIESRRSQRRWNFVVRKVRPGVAAWNALSAQLSLVRRSS